MSKLGANPWIFPALAALWLGTAQSAAAQVTPTLVRTWSASSGDYFLGALPHPANGHYVVGSTSISGRGGETLVQRYDLANALDWTTTWGTSANEGSSGFALAPDQSLYVCDTTVDMTALDVLLLRFNASGTLALETRWDSNSPSSMHQNDNASTVFLDVAGNVYVAGDTQAGGQAPVDVLVMNYGPIPANATIPKAVSWGGSSADAINGGCSDGTSAFVAGNTQSYDAGGGTDVLVQGYNANLSLSWSRSWGGNGTDDAYSMTCDAAGNLYVVGATNTAAFTSGGTDALIMKWSNQGTLLWVRIWGQSGEDDLNGVTVDDCGNVIAGGSTTSFSGNGSLDALLLKFNPAGDLLWASTFGAPGENEVFVTPTVAPKSQGRSILAPGLKGCSPGSVTIVTGVLNTNPSPSFTGNQDGVSPVCLSGATLPVSGTLDSPSNAMCSGGEAMFVTLNPSGPGAGTAGRVCAPNPTSYTADAPVLGSCWTASVDLTTTGHSSAIVLFYDAPAMLPLSSGQCVLVAGNRLAKLPPMTGPAALWSFSIPNSVSLAGLVIHSQAVHVLGASPLVLSNAVDMTVGY